jgi:hypothetical protein
MRFIEGFKSLYLSEYIKINIFNSPISQHIELVDTSTLSEILLSEDETVSLILQIRRYTKPDIEHPYNTQPYILDTFTIKWILQRTHFLTINKSADRIRLDEASVFSLLDLFKNIH